MAQKDAAAQYTVFIRLPFPRGDFVDPPLVDWDAAKDRALWSIMSQNPKSADLNWSDLANKFNVPLPFLLQQAAHLYSHQLSHVRAQMRRLGSSSRPSSIVGAPEGLSSMLASPGGGGVSAEASRSGSGSGGSFTARGSHSGSGSGRGSFRGTAAALAGAGGSLDGVVEKEKSARGVGAGGERLPNVVASLNRARGQSQGYAQQSQLSNLPPPSETALTSSSRHSSSSDDEDEDEDDSTPIPTRSLRRPPGRSQLFRPARVTSPHASYDRATSPTFLPLSEEEHEQQQAVNTARWANHSSQHQQSDMGATLRSPERANTAIRDEAAAQRTWQHGQQAHRRVSGTGGTANTTPSMGSSFSDLEDTSMTQSALEEALASHMRSRGTSVSAASKMSEFSQSSRR